MDLLVVGLSGLLNILMMIAFVAIVLKLFQVQTTLEEIKELLRTGGRATVALAAQTETAAPVSYRPAPTPVPPPPPIANPLALHEMGSGEAMLRALDAELHLEEASRTPESIEPRS
jgi:hypothetical protein